MRVLALICFVLTSVTVRAEELSVGNLRFNWEAGWSREDSDGLIRFVSPSSPFRGVTIDSLDKEVSQEEYVRYAKGALPALASRHGHLVEDLKAETLPSGAIVYSIAFYDDAQ